MAGSFLLLLAMCGATEIEVDANAGTTVHPTNGFPDFCTVAGLPEDEEGYTNGWLRCIPSEFGPQTANVIGDLALAEPFDACTPLSEVAGKILLVGRGNCTFYSKALQAKAAGAVGVVLVDSIASPYPLQLVMTPAEEEQAGPEDSLPMVSILQSEGLMLKNGAANHSIKFRLAFRPSWRYLEDEGNAKEIIKKEGRLSIIGHYRLAVALQNQGVDSAEKAKQSLRTLRKLMKILVKVEAQPDGEWTYQKICLHMLGLGLLLKEQGELKAASAAFSSAQSLVFLLREGFTAFQLQQSGKGAGASKLAQKIPSFGRDAPKSTKVTRQIAYHTCLVQRLSGSPEACLLTLDSLIRENADNAEAQLLKWCALHDVATRTDSGTTEDLASASAKLLTLEALSAHHAQFSSDSPVQSRTALCEQVALQHSASLREIVQGSDHLEL